jgi:hypothetical protein
LIVWGHININLRRVCVLFFFNLLEEVTLQNSLFRNSTYSFSPFECLSS